LFTQLDNLNYLLGL